MMELKQLDNSLPGVELKPNLEDTTSGYSHLTTPELVRGYLIFYLVQFPLITKILTFILNQSLKWHLPIQTIIRYTMFQQFCGGSNRNELQELAKKLHSHKVGVICDYAMEAKESDEEFERARQEVLDNIHQSAAMPHLYPFVVFKMTALARFAILEKISAGSLLSQEEESSWALSQKRAEAIFDLAAAKKVKVLVDAEESWINPAIDCFLEAAMATYNKKDQPIVFQTLQMYLKDRMDYLHFSAKKAEAKGYELAFKLVRGAYLEKEISRSQANGRPVPVFEKKEDTDAAFDEAVAFCLTKSPAISILIGSHNVASTHKAIAFQRDRGISWNHKKLWFSQLYGMSDPLSFNLARYGFQVTKYVPYGPVKEAVPYLLRRAQENTSVAGQSTRELEMMSAEVKRRRNAI